MMVVHLTLHPHRKAVLLIEIAMNAGSDDEESDEESPNQQIVERMQELKNKAQKNIKASQKRIKDQYDKKALLDEVGI